MSSSRKSVPSSLKHFSLSNLKTLAPISLLQRHLTSSATPSTSAAPPPSFTPSSCSTFSIDTHLLCRSPPPAVLPSQSTPISAVVHPHLSGSTFLIDTYLHLVHPHLSRDTCMF
ncbi:hypothetical protein HanRHA438_Chr13g0586571 [Helianthus annuus]|nr:hypothetical protein HanHA300_Chr13g0471841 [Helianthus annuus]KAJ0480017.1 hypothetical protein HanIR_Chr13g0626681 [Helianthus annuus]KAJ0496781.1 hypothetical protein HanHA89_Chr13g0503741 [Helianthus annuus]KAJ0662814.1 hypothetical protein HanLR1_Chr13g0473931 [Helianthus annuus]KAJ0670324.1 hypothetical protein HanOQP8_Chr13g0472871 [Helianthus annuus]